MLHLLHYTSTQPKLHCGIQRGRDVGGWVKILKIASFIKGDTKNPVKDITQKAYCNVS